MKKKVWKFGNYKRKDYCEKCGKKEFGRGKEYDADGFMTRKGKKKDRNYLTIHHIDHNRENSANSNLQTLCKDCHNDIHRGEIKL